MFYYIKGTVSEISTGDIILESGGMGFLIHSSLKTISHLSQGQQVKLYISESIGESNYDLYGFFDLQEKRFFELLISVSGVGPKAAISLLSTMNTDSLILSIMNDDSKALVSAPGIGKKIAQRIILELRDKIGAEIPSMAAKIDNIDLSQSPAVTTSAVADAMAALTVLGYSTAELTPLIRKGNWSGMTADQIIRAVLKQMI